MDAISATRQAEFEAADQQIAKGCMWALARVPHLVVLWFGLALIWRWTHDWLSCAVAAFVLWWVLIDSEQRWKAILAFGAGLLKARRVSMDGARLIRSYAAVRPSLPNFPILAPIAGFFRVVFAVIGWLGANIPRFWPWIVIGLFLLAFFAMRGWLDRFVERPLEDWFKSDQRLIEERNEARKSAVVYSWERDRAYVAIDRAENTHRVERAVTTIVNEAENELRHARSFDELAGIYSRSYEFVWNPESAPPNGEPGSDAGGLRGLHPASSGEGLPAGGYG